MTKSRERRINGSPSTYPGLQHRRDQKQGKGRRKEPEGKIVKTRESHIWRTNKKWNHSIPETTYHYWYYKIEDHDKGVSSNNGVIELIVTQKRARRAEFKPNNQR